MPLWVTSRRESKDISSFESPFLYSFLQTSGRHEVTVWWYIGSGQTRMLGYNVSNCETNFESQNVLYFGTEGVPIKKLCINLICKWMKIYITCVCSLWIYYQVPMKLQIWAAIFFLKNGISFATSLWKKRKQFLAPTTGETYTWLISGSRTTPDLYKIKTSRNSE